jgi:putative ABC transport system substrate-binding protein
MLYGVWVFQPGLITDGADMELGRRDFLTLLGSMTMIGVTTPSFGQPANKNARIGFLMGLADDPEARMRIKTFEDELRKEGWVVGQNVQIDYRFAAGDSQRMQVLAKELVDLKPDLIVGHSTPVVRELGKATRTIPIVFVVVADPVGSGFAKSIPRPEGNMTGFTNLDSGITGKLLTILKQIAPTIRGAAIMYNSETGPMGGLFYSRAFEEAAPSFGVKPINADARTPADIEKVMAELGRESNAGLIVVPDNFTTVNRDLIISLASRWKIPTIYPYRYFAEAGGLMSYGVDVTDLFRRAPEYVSRILRGAKPGELPIQAPTKFELVINLKAAKALGLVVPKILLAGAEALIE